MIYGMVCSGDDDEGGDDEEKTEDEETWKDEELEKEPAKPTCCDYFMHFLSVPWKLLFATIPPTGQLVCFKKKEKKQLESAAYFIFMSYMVSQLSCVYTAACFLASSSHAHL